jgi:hypothetical protein
LRLHLDIFIKDLVLFNLIALAGAFVLYLFGRNIYSDFLVILFLMSALLLILGGALGFFLSGVSFQSLMRLLRGKSPKDDSKTDDERKRETKESIGTGKVLAIMGGALLLESLLLALISSL